MTPQPTPSALSKCCGAPIKETGSEDMGEICTMYYVCTKCNKPCYPPAGAGTDVSPKAEIVQPASAVQDDQELREEICRAGTIVTRAIKNADTDADAAVVEYVDSIMALIHREREKAVQEERIQWEKSALALADYHCKRFV